MGRWWVAAGCLLIGCGQQAGRSGSGIISGQEQQPGPDGGGNPNAGSGSSDGGPGDGGTAACIGGANILANSGSGQPLCARTFPGLPAPSPDVQDYIRSPSQTCRAAWINGRNDIVQANDIETTTDLYERPHESPGRSSLFGLGKLLGVYGPLDDGFFLQLDQFSPAPVYLFGTHLLDAETFLVPRGPSAGARDPRLGGVIVGAPGRGFPCDQTPEDEGTPHDCTSMPDGIYLRKFGPDAAPRFPGLRLFDPLGADGRVAVGTDLNGWTLVLAIQADGSTAGRWVDPGGTAGQPKSFGVLPSGPVTDAVLAPLARGGLAYRRNGDWVRIFDPSEGDSAPPCWLAGLSGFDLRVAANGNGYAAIPTDRVDRQCDRAIDVYTLDGTACGSIALGTSDESCTDHVTLGPQGSVLRLLQGPPFEGGHPSCELRTWPGLLGPSP